MRVCLVLKLLISKEKNKNYCLIFKFKYFGYYKKQFEDIISNLNKEKNKIEVANAELQVKMLNSVVQKDSSTLYQTRMF